MTHRRPTPRLGISAVIPTRDVGRPLRATLRSLSAQSTQIDEILVVAHAAAGRDADPLRQEFPAVRWIEPGSTPACAARNLAAAAAEREVLFMLDPASAPGDGVFDSVRRAFAEVPRLGAIACRVQTTATPQPREPDCLAGLIDSAAAAIRRAAFLDVGGYPVDLDPHTGDYDLSCRLWRAGWHVVSRGDLAMTRAPQASGHEDLPSLGLLLRNSLTLWDRYAPDDLRAPLLQETVDRFRNLAQRGGTIEDLHDDLAAWKTQSRRPRRTRPLTQTQFDGLFGLPLVRARLRHERDRLQLRRVGLWGRGVGCPQLCAVLADLHVDVAAVYEAEPHPNDRRGCPVQSRQALDADPPDAVLPGTLSLAAAERQAAELRGLSLRCPVTTAVDWEATACVAADPHRADSADPSARGSPRPTSFGPVGNAPRG